jgi:hypothetical protein
MLIVFSNSFAPVTANSFAENTCLEKLYVLNVMFHVCFANKFAVTGANECANTYNILRFNLRKRLFEIRFDVRNMLNADRDAQQIWRNARCQLCGIRQLLMRRCGRLNDERF